MKLLRILAAVMACSAAACGVDVVDTVEITVQPRVVLDGTIELSDRTAGRVVIDEVIAHAPSALLRAAVAGDEGDVVVDESDPLLFRYAIADRTGTLAALGAQRTWSMPASGAALDVAFANANADIAADIAADMGGDIAAESDVLADLGGHTLIIHGTLAVETEMDGDGFGGFGDVDPDGGAANPGDPGDVAADVDPDGGAAEPVDDGVSPADVDPDGGAAEPVDDGVSPADVDPDGGAAEPIDDGVSPADVDPDGGAAEPVDDDVNPADVDPDGGAADGAEAAGRTRQAKAKKRAHGQVRRATVNVPFSLVVDGSFSLEVIVDDASIAAVGDGEVMPIDLHLATSALLSDARLVGLEESAVAALASETPSVSMSLSNVGAAADVRVPASIKKPARVVGFSSKIKVSGDLRE
jgi:hypothetical protein